MSQICRTFRTLNVACFQLVGGKCRLYVQMHSKVNVYLHVFEL